MRRWMRDGPFCSWMESMDFLESDGRSRILSGVTSTEVDLMHAAWGASSKPWSKAVDNIENRFVEQKPKPNRPQPLAMLMEG